MIKKEETSKLLRDLVKIQSPYFQEHQVMAYAMEWMSRQGLSPRLHTYADDKVTGFHGENVWLELDGAGDGPVICLNGHLDTVQVCNGWSRPTTGAVEGDRLYGVGALDMKSGCAALMVALAHFRKEHPVFRGKIKASFVSVEEGPFGLGTNALIEDGLLDDADFCIVAEPSAGFTGKPFPTLCLGARGGYGLDVEFYGKSAHAASPELGISAAEDMAAFVQELRHVQYVEDPHLGKGTCCVVAMHADGGACSVPDFASVKLFWHIVVGESPETITAEIEAAIRRAGIRGRYAIRFREAPSEGSKGFMPYTVERDHPMVKRFEDSVVRVTGVAPEIDYFQSIGDFCYLGTRLNAPAIIFGATGARFHSEDEYVELDSVWKTAQVIYDFLVETLVR